MRDCLAVIGGHLNAVHAKEVDKANVLGQHHTYEQLTDHAEVFRYLFFYRNYDGNYVSAHLWSALGADYGNHEMVVEIPFEDTRWRNIEGLWPWEWEPVAFLASYELYKAIHDWGRQFYDYGLLWLHAIRYTIDRRWRSSDKLECLKCLDETIAKIERDELKFPGSLYFPKGKGPDRC